MSKVKKGEEEHYMKCGGCDEMLDMRDLSEVFRHEHDEENYPPLDSSKISSRKIGKPEQYQDGRTINLN